MRLVATPQQTAGPFLAIGLQPLERRELVEPSRPGARRLGGTLLDGAGVGIPDGVVELWSASTASAEGLGAADRRPTWPEGFGRCLTGPAGEYCFVVAKPAGLPDAGAPHFEVIVFARGLLRSLRTRVYFPGEAANAADPVLSALDEPLRRTLVATDDGSGWRFDICLQGANETVFFGC
jgi:protocatechuate 3,4-dioxygenase alpha subunit